MQDPPKEKRLQLVVMSLLEQRKKERGRMDGTLFRGKDLSVLLYCRLSFWVVFAMVDVSGGLHLA